MKTINAVVAVVIVTTFLFGSILAVDQLHAAEQSQEVVAIQSDAVNAGKENVPIIDGQEIIILNSADETELRSLPGVGPKTAEAIVKYRQENGNFISVDELVKVKGIGPKKLEKIRPYLRV